MVLHLRQYMLDKTNIWYTGEIKQIMQFLKKNKDNAYTKEEIGRITNKEYTDKTIQGIRRRQRTITKEEKINVIKTDGKTYYHYMKCE